MRQGKTAIAFAVTLVLGFACSKKPDLPVSLKSVPADANIIASVDAKGLINYAKQTLSTLVPTTLKDKAPSFELLAQQAMQLIGLDINLLSRITWMGYVGSDEKMAFIAEGLTTKGLKGEKKGTHNGTDLYAMDEEIVYAELKNLGVVAAPNEEMVKKVLDTHAGKEKSLASTDNANTFSELAKTEKDLDQIRLYILSTDTPKADIIPFKMKKLGVFFHLDKGASATVVSDEDGAKMIKSQFDLGKAALQIALTTGKTDSLNLPLSLDDEAKKLVSDLLGKVNAQQNKETISITYRGDLKPILNKAVAMGVGQWAEEKDSEETPQDEPTEDKTTEQGSPTEKSQKPQEKANTKKSGQENTD